MAAGDSGSFTITGVVNGAGNAKNTAAIDPSTPGCTTQCGGGTASTPSLPVGSGPFFTQTKTADASSYIVGQAITYTVGISNTGTSTGSATVTDTVPSNVTVSAVTCAAATGSDTCTAGPQTNAVSG